MMIPSPQVDLSTGGLWQWSADTLKALVQYNIPPRLFRMHSVLVRLEGSAGSLVPVQLTEDRLRHELSKCVTFMKLVKKGLRPVPPPMDVVRDILATPNLPLPDLDGVVKAPFFGPSGQQVLHFGYDSQSKLYLDSQVSVLLPTVPPSPSSSDVAQALQLIDDLVVDFPFAGATDRAHALALFITPFVRAMIPGAVPVFLVEADVHGTGKTLLLIVLLFPSMGNSPALTPAPTDGQEWRKVVTSVFMAGRGIVVLEDVRDIDAPAFATAVTAPRWEDRVLSKNLLFQAPNRVMFCMTGNNPALSGELNRRTVRIRLTANTQSPWTRTGFQHPDIMAWVRQNCPALMHAALVLVQNWLALGRPACTAPVLGSMEQWREVVGGVLEAAGVQGFLGHAAQPSVALDPEAAALQQLVHAWHAKHACNAVGVKDLWELAKDMTDLPLPWRSTQSGLTSAFGKLLRKYQDRVVGNLQVRFGGHLHGAAQWKLEPVNVPTNPPPTLTAPGPAPQAAAVKVVKVGEGFSTLHAGEEQKKDIEKDGEKPSLPSPPSPEPPARPSGDGEGARKDVHQPSLEDRG